jgi:hypothetical protein
MGPQLTSAEIEALAPEQLVNKLWDKRIRNKVIRTLVGGLTATELRTTARLSAEARDAIIHGLEHWSPSVRWWCLQLIDHLADESLLAHVVLLLNDPVQRVRKQAEHTLTCEACKQDSTLAITGRRLLAEARGAA